MFKLLRNYIGRVLTAKKSTTANVNAGYTAMLTVVGDVWLEEAFLVSGSANTNLTSAALKVGNGGYDVITAADAVVANLNVAGKRLRSTTGQLPYLLTDGQTLGLDLQGTAGTASNLRIVTKIRKTTADSGVS